ncbi:assimilatory nitrite reductase subunit [Bacillus subtilis]|nr:assimilatory nitrite reductase subunit [Bacillus subtilis]
MNETLSVHKDPWKDFLEDKQTSKELFENVVTTS